MFGLRIKLLICLGSLLLILIAVTLLATSLLERSGDRMQQLVRENLESITACEAMKEAIEIIDQQVQKRVWGDRSADLASIAPLADDFERALTRQLEQSNRPSKREAAAELGDLWRQYRGDLPYVFAIDHSDGDRRNSYLLTLMPISRQIRETAQRIVEMNLTDMVSRHGQAQSNTRGATHAMHSLMLAGVCVALLVIMLSGRFVLRPLDDLTGAARAIAGGDLETVVPIRTRDEIGLLARTFNDMTGQLRTLRRIDHERLLRVQRTTQLAINSLPDAVVVIDPKGKIELTNQTAKRLFALDPDRNVSELPSTWLSDLHRRAMSDPAPHHLAGYDGTMVVKNQGHELHFMPRTFPIVDEHGALIGGLVVLADVTELRQLDEMKNKLLAFVSHELKTPLTSMRMIMHLMADDKVGPLNHKQRELMIAAREDSDRLHHIVENLMDMGRIESGQALMEIRPTDAAELARQAVESKRSSFAFKQVDLQLEISGPLPAVMADANRIGHVLQNLLSNALKYTAEYGRVLVTVRETEHDEVEFAVSDDGRGIPRQYVSRVFEKFFRVPGQSGISGTGLGLAIVKDIVEAHGGRVWVESREGRGTTFRFVLPHAHLTEQEIDTSTTTEVA